MSTLPFSHLHKQIVIHLVYFVVLWLNAFPAKSGISGKLSPREIVTHKKLDYDKHCQVNFGSYVEAHNDPDITYDMMPRTHESIALGPSGNMQGTQKVFCINTGRVLKWRKITEYPLPTRVITKVNNWGKRSKKEEYGNKLAFLNRHKEKYDWDNDEIAEEEGMVKDEPYTELIAEIPGI